MRLSCVYLVVATVTTIIASANAAAEASEPMPNIAKYASPEVSVHLGAEREKRLLRFDSNDYRDDDDEEERANAANLFNVDKLTVYVNKAQKRTANNVSGSLLNYFKRLEAYGYSPVKLGNRIPDEEYDNLRMLYRSWYYHNK
ncbi:PexRD8 family secreted RxLR effector peptide, putative [Phytophthora infestans T30-4]|uniref:RxLR effector protein n=4 Tax=Phytophthora infestans TaxID=4787 RepID=D0NQZ2_PHYIT|nr:PexRD8 family secreted RxLR effector peptide, putative [Phytophthora infestans T30-4]KAF4028005.1 RXLR domain-containing protein [Phytophthora infestans]EEY63090.1 PexRD8 family secreted RxLR effector peptide, putative [Phytophthora infestans T30-4]KAF4028006.1 RXLR domain-containing protein [Phytophthora infestans]KAF4034845.1 RXLR domain-containing protein [Phytophthora infestans]KAF4034846.1 RXLR domain-containing protein [Phytophthora infestans]|eukprot:XP_002898613.1 PexRD8 family secreted RxLR effector peptide, putative [Phytophthora infestans T30-4]